MSQKYINIQKKNHETKETTTPRSNPELTTNPEAANLRVQNTIKQSHV